MSQVDEILSGPEYFYCEKEHCRLRIDVCLERQEANQKRSPFMPVPFISCEGCDQGAKNQLLMKTGMTINPKRGKGQRNLSCEHYSECLGIAAHEDWKSFNCEHCSYFEPELKEVSKIAEKEENTRICSECGKNFTIQPNSPLCASCIGKKAWKDRKTKNKGLGKAKRKETGQDIRKTEKVQQRGDMEFTIRFGKYKYLLKAVEELAEKEIRSIDEQIIYILKDYLSNTQHPGAVK